MVEQALVVAPGVLIEIELIGEESERLVLEIVPDEQADFYAGYLGERTPLAQALLGRHAGEVVDTPAGWARILALRIDDRRLHQAKANAARRQEALQQTQKEIARTNAVTFSTTVEGKWGDYDPDGIKW